MRRKISIFTLICILLFFALNTSVSSKEYHTEKQIQEEIADVSFHWSNFLGAGNWKTFKLWDDGFSTHFYLSFKLGVNIALDIPATLKVKYPTLVEPGEQFQIETSLSLPGNRILTITSQFYMGIDLDLPGLGFPIPGVGWVDKIKNIYGGEWKFTFDLNSKVIEQVMDRIWLGDFNLQESFKRTLNLYDFVTLEKMSMNSHTLGELVLGKIRINLLKAIFLIAESLSAVALPIQVAIKILDWLLTNVIKVSTGLIVTPSLAAMIVSPISVNPKIELDVNSLIFNEDISSKLLRPKVVSSAEETRGDNSLSVNQGPIEFRLLFNTEWDYYIDLDVNFLGLNLYKNQWSWDLFEYPKLNWDSNVVEQKVDCNIKLDESLQATAPSSKDGEVSIDLTDKSGISKVELYYSTDKNSWKTITVTSHSNTYSATPIRSVSEDTTVYYFIEVTDGDGDTYKIDNNGDYFNYVLKPTFISRIPIVKDVVLFLNDIFPGYGEIAFVVVTFCIVSVPIVVILIRKRKTY